MKKIFFIAASLFAASLLGVSCDNSGTDSTTPAAAPEIVSIYPASAPAGESVTIAGKNFSADAASNVVTFGSAAATVAQASATELVVTVPEIEAGQVDVAVKVGDKSSAAVKFTVEAALSITECNASVVTAGDIVTVEGAGFEGATIKIGETVITPTLAYDDFFRFDMPSLAKGEHQISVSKNGKTVQSEKFVYYSLPQYEVSVWAGDYTQAMTAGALTTAAQFNFPEDLAWDTDGNLWVSHRSGKAVSCIDMQNMTNGNPISTSANTFGIAYYGNSLYAANKSTHKLGIVTNSTHSNFDSAYKFDSAMDVICGDNSVYVACRDSKKIAVVSSDNQVTEIALDIKPWAISFNKDKSGIFVGPNDANKIYLYDIAAKTQAVVAGNGQAPADDNTIDGLAQNALIGQVVGLYCDEDGYLYFSDASACRFRVLIPGVGGDYSKGIVKTLAGTAIGTDGGHGKVSDHAVGDGLTEAKFGKEGIGGIVKYNDGFLVAGQKRHVIYKISPKVTQ